MRQNYNNLKDLAIILFYFNTLKLEIIIDSL